MRLTRWSKEAAPSVESLRASLAADGFQVSEWADLPGTVYPLRTHDHLEVRWVVRGRLRVGMPESGEEVTLESGDRLELEQNVPYWMDVDDQPVMYLIGIKNGSKK